jgi:hypothetical protein
MPRRAVTNAKLPTTPPTIIFVREALVLEEMAAVVVADAASAELGASFAVVEDGEGDDD